MTKLIPSVAETATATNTRHLSFSVDYYGISITGRSCEWFPKDCFVVAYQPWCNSRRSYRKTWFSHGNSRKNKYRGKNLGHDGSWELGKISSEYRQGNITSKKQSWPRMGNCRKSPHRSCKYRKTMSVNLRGDLVLPKIFYNSVDDQTHPQRCWDGHSHQHQAPLLFGGLLWNFYNWSFLWMVPQKIVLL